MQFRYRSKRSLAYRCGSTNPVLLSVVRQIGFLTRGISQHFGSAFYVYDYILQNQVGVLMCGVNFSPILYNMDKPYEEGWSRTHRTAGITFFRYESCSHCHFFWGLAINFSRRTTKHVLYLYYSAENVNGEIYRNQHNPQNRGFINIDWFIKTRDTEAFFVVMALTLVK